MPKPNYVHETKHQLHASLRIQHVLLPAVDEINTLISLHHSYLLFIFTKPSVMVSTCTVGRCAEYNPTMKHTIPVVYFKVYRCALNTLTLFSSSYSCWEACTVSFMSWEITSRWYPWSSLVIFQALCMQFWCPSAWVSSECLRRSWTCSDKLTFDFTLKWGMLVFEESIPSVIIAMYFSGIFLALLWCL